MAFTTRWIGSGVVSAPDAFSVIIRQLSEHLQMAVGRATAGKPVPEALAVTCGLTVSRTL